MRKSQLIKMLQDIPGDPEVVLWNGFVSDWMPLEAPTIGKLVKMKADTWESFVKLERIQAGQPSEITEADKRRYRDNIRWECPNEYTANQHSMYKQKKVIWIVPKTKGVTTWDRAGTVSY